MLERGLGNVGVWRVGRLHEWATLEAGNRRKAKHVLSFKIFFLKKIKAEQDALMGDLTDLQIKIQVPYPAQVKHFWVPSNFVRHLACSQRSNEITLQLRPCPTFSLGATSHRKLSSAYIMMIYHDESKHLSELGQALIQHLWCVDHIQRNDQDMPSPAILCAIAAAPLIFSSW